MEFENFNLWMSRNFNKLNKGQVADILKLDSRTAAKVVNSIRRIHSSFYEENNEYGKNCINITHFKEYLKERSIHL